MESPMTGSDTEWDDPRCIHLRGEKEGRCDALLVWPEGNYLENLSSLHQVFLLPI